MLILLIALTIRLCLLPIRWINPDEGPHLLDARLLLQGYTPIADYGSRQPLYVFALAFFLKAFGTSLQIGRLVPLLASIATGWMLFILGRRLVNATAGLIASALYIFLPLTVAWSVIVKEEPLAIFLSTLCFYFLARACDETARRACWWVGTGVAAALAYYARPSTLYLVLAVATFIVLSPDNSLKKILIKLSLFLVGYVVVCLAFCTFFLSKMSWQEILFSQLNPLNLVWNRLLLLFGMLPPAYRVVDTEGFRILDQSLGDTVKAWRDSIFFSLFILTAAIATISRSEDEKQKIEKSHVIAQLQRRNKGNLVPKLSLGTRLPPAMSEVLPSNRFPAFLLSTCWAGSVLLLYLFQSANRGFFTQYFVEALPPLSILAAMRFLRISKEMKWSPVSFFPACMGGFFLLYFVQRIAWQINPGLMVYMICGCLAASVSVFIIRPLRLGLSKRIGLFFLPAASAAVIMTLAGLFRLEQVAAVIVTLLMMHLMVNAIYEKYSGDPTCSEKMAAIFVVIASLVMSGLFSGQAIGPKYEGVWSSRTLVQVVQVIKTQGEASQEILSGGTIWTFESGFQPFLNVSHPTEFFKKRLEDFEAQFRNHRPMFIIDDGYTQRKYSRYWLFIGDELETHYSKAVSAPGSKYPVTVYRLVANPLSEETFLTWNERLSYPNQPGAIP